MSVEYDKAMCFVLFFCIWIVMLLNIMSYASNKKISYE